MVEIKYWRSLWFWIALQLFTGVLAIVCLNIFRIRGQVVLPLQWAAIVIVLYLQVRQGKITGTEIIFNKGNFRKWAIVTIPIFPFSAVMYKCVDAGEGWDWVSIFPFERSKFRLVSLLKIQTIKVLVWVRLIK